MVPFVTILVPTKNVAPYIGQVLQSLMDLDYPKDRLEIVVLDGFSDDGTTDIIKKFPVILHEGGWNVPEFYNRVMNTVNGEIIAFGDGDAIVDKTWLKTLIPHFEDQQVAGAGGLCLTANPEHLVPRVIGYELKARYECMPKNISRIATMNVAYRKSSLLDIGGFNETLDTGYDTEIGHRLRHAGYFIHFDPKAVVFHYNRPTIRSYFRQQYIYGRNIARMYVQNVHIAAGDEITPVWMNIQPFLYSFIFLSLVAAILFPVAVIPGLGVLLCLFFVYTFTAIKLSYQEKDMRALFFIVLCFIRGIAWTLGGASYTILALKNTIQKQISSRSD